MRGTAFACTIWLNITQHVNGNKLQVFQPDARYLLGVNITQQHVADLQHFNIIDR